MAKQIDVTPDQDGGVLKIILQESGGELVPSGCTAIVHYVGTLEDGTKFDSSRDRNEPFQFELGAGKVIKAWDLGVASMRVGERATLICKPNYAYGESKMDKIPANSTLHFDVEVLNFKLEDLSAEQDRSIERKIITHGKGSNPREDAFVEIHLVKEENGKVVEERDVCYTLGEGLDFDLPEAMDFALTKFKEGETSRLYIEKKDPSQPKNKAGPKDPQEYVVTLKKFVNPKQSWELDKEAQIEQAKQFKEKGTNYFKAAKYQLAIKMYDRVKDYCPTHSGDITPEQNELLLAAHLNISLANLKLKDFYAARKAANEALEIDAKNEKALYRRGLALLGISEPELAQADFNECLKIDPNNKASQQQLLECTKMLKKQLQNEKKIYANMFDKFAKTDTQREEFEKKKLPNVLSSVGEWGQEDREREPSEFERENPNILMLNSSGEFKDM